MEAIQNNAVAHFLGLRGLVDKLYHTLARRQRLLQRGS